MARRILLVWFVAFALCVGAMAMSASAAGPAPLPSSADEPDTGCSDPAPAMLTADIRVNSGV